ncbi:hypothetical protein BFP76_04835 [Amylibacter kogurei]|uniref:Uncharacterized protein n=2 Tax=Paramylibacter kogurei TaxID=1889778 RepID=A0A2G5K6N4_9RHOB|nr:hypothetical protein BFP76_04835 [Amylibacter kogurei]
MTQSVIVMLTSIFAIALGCWCARKPEKTMHGILLGTSVGIGTALILHFLVSLLSYIFPFGQIDYWFATFIGKVMF